jgi:hypothetical protein
MGIEGMAHGYGTALILAALALVVITLVADLWIARLRSRYEARFRTPVPRGSLQVRAFGRSQQLQAAMRRGEEAERLELARQNLESQLGQAVRTKVVKGSAFVKR